MNTAAQYHEIYSDNILELIYHKIIALQTKSEKKIEYDVRINDRIITPRNSELEALLNIKNLISRSTQYISIHIYFEGNREYSERYMLHVKENKFTRNMSGMSGMSGMSNGESETASKATNIVNSGNSEDSTNSENSTNLSSSIKEFELRESLRKDLHYEHLIDENKNLKKQIEDLEKRLIELLIERKEIIANKTKGIENLSGTIAMGLLSVPFIKETIGRFTGFSGVDTTAKAATAAEEEPKASNVNFTSSEENEEDEELDGVVVDSVYEPYMSIFENGANRLNEAQLSVLMNMFNLLVFNPNCIDFMNKHLMYCLKRIQKEQK